MENKFNSRVYGCAIIRSINANYNADFSHQPRTLPNGVCYATDKALKYLIRNFLKDMYDKETIFYFKSYDKKLKPLNLNGRFLDLFKMFPKNTAAVSDKLGEFYIFSKEGDKIDGIIGTKIPKKKVEDFFKDLSSDSELKDRKNDYLKIADKSVKSKGLSTIKIPIEEDEDDYYFYFLDDKLQKILKDEKSEEIMKGIELKLSGGINKPEFTKNLLSCLDIRLFGATYAGETNISIHGPVQINHGLNVWSENNIFSEQIMSPFADKEGAESTTLGRQSKLQEGHYLHHFSINPKNIDELARFADNADVLSISDIDKLKEAMRCGATYFDSAAKAGVDNEALIWVKLKEGAKNVLPTFNNLIKLTKENEKIMLDFSAFTNTVERIADSIENIEIHYLQESVFIKNEPSVATHHDIVSGLKILNI